MDADPIIVRLEQPDLIELNGTNSNVTEVLPVIWAALESLTSPELMSRITGLGRIIKLDAAHQYPLVIYILVTRITEPDIELRTRIVQQLASILVAGTNGDRKIASSIDEVKKTLTTYLAGLRTRHLFALLQVTEFDKSAEEAVASLLSYCSFAGEHLAQILSNRTAPLSIRRQAANFIGRIGYLDALPALERLASRLENRKEEDDAGILIGLQETIRLLYTP
jgi:hypothetical protein